MQLVLWYPEDYKAPTVPFYVPVMARVYDGTGKYSYEWEIQNDILTVDIPYESYIRENICSLGFLNVGTLRVTCTATDLITGEKVSEIIDVEGHTVDQTGYYYFDEVPVATYYDDTYLPDFSIEWEKKFHGEDAFKGGFIYYIGKYKFVDDDWDKSVDYSEFVDVINEIMNRTLQPDQMWERYFKSDCVCHYSISDPVETYFPTKVTLLQMFNADDGIGFHIKLRSDFSLQAAIGRLYQALMFVCFNKNINTGIALTMQNQLTAPMPVAYYDEILDALDADVAETYERMKKTVDSDYIYELVQDETIAFLSKKSYDNNISLLEWGPDMSVVDRYREKTRQ